MRVAICLAALCVPLLTAAAVTAQDNGTGIPGVSNPDRARIDYQLKCQGCHRPNGDGNGFTTPPLNNEVARFLHVAGGREFLVQVPGVAMVDLNDARLAELMNWTLYRFDAGHIPADFKPFTAEEIAELRRKPIRLDRVKTRADLVAQFE